jgi:hypothetical protein
MKTRKDENRKDTEEFTWEELFFFRAFVMGSWFLSPVRLMSKGATSLAASTPVLLLKFLIS